ncbi:MAG: hypothetical protein J6I64_00270 [Lachnospiraceae bacterium]|nr:hypothetical protein [Lachnospiraceae bacterium]
MNQNQVKNTHKYDDILHLPHPVSKKHPQMAMIDRAAQFSPFAALTGYDAAIRETGRLTDDFIELEEYDKSVLDERIRMLRDRLSDHPVITVTYFLPDDKKEGGTYRQSRNRVKKIDEYRRVLTMIDGLEIRFENICKIEGDFFAHSIHL